MKEAILMSYDCFNLQRPENSITEEELTTLLSNYLNDLLNRNVNDVLTILYRIDVSEIKVNEILFGQELKTSVGEAFAKLIIERQKLKLHYRKIYAQKRAN